MRSQVAGGHRLNSSGRSPLGYCRVWRSFASALMVHRSFGGRDIRPCSMATNRADHIEPTKPFLTCSLESWRVQAMTRGNRVLASAIVVGVLIEVRWTEVLTGILGFLRGKAFQVAGLGTSVGPIEGHALPTAPQLAMALLMATGLGL